LFCRDFFFLSRFFPLIHFVLFKFYRPSSCHFMFHASPYTTNTTQTSMPPAGFELTIPVSERPKTHALDRAATGIGFDSIPGPSSPVRSESLYRLRYPGPLTTGVSKFLLSQ
jgi:hypothetical protein